MWVSSVAPIDSFDKQALAKINEFKSSHNIFAAASLMEDDGSVVKQTALEVIEEIDKEAQVKIAEQLKGVQEFKPDGYTALVRNDGTVSNYDIGVDKDTYSEVTQQDRRAPILLGKMIAEVTEKQVAGKLNWEILQELERYSDKHYKRGDKNFIEIGPDAKSDSKVGANYAKQVWQDAPQNFKYNVKKKKEGKRYIAIRRSDAQLVFGKRAPSILSLHLPFTNNTIRYTLKDTGYGFINSYVKMAEDMWKDIGAFEKAGYVIRTPMTFLNNVWSNFNYSVTLGMSPLEVLKQQTAMAKATKSYLKNKKRFNEIVYDLKHSKLTKEERSKLVNEFSSIKLTIKDNPVRPLMLAGQYTSITDDVNVSSLQAKSRVETLFAPITNRVPNVLKDVGSELFMLNGSHTFSSMALFTQYSDFVARAARYNYMVKEEGMKSDKALKVVLDEFVNYSVSLPTPIKYASDMAFYLFPSYFFGANRNLIQNARSKPLNLLAMGAMLDGVAPNPTESSFILKDYSVPIQSITDIGYDTPIDIVTEPALLKATGLI